MTSRVANPGIVAVRSGGEIMNTSAVLQASEALLDACRSLSFPFGGL